MWRKPLRRCNLKLFLSILIIGNVFVLSLFAQNSSEKKSLQTSKPVAPVSPIKPVMDVQGVGEITMPKMPSMFTSMPNFQNQYVPGKKQSSTVQTESSKENLSENKKEGQLTENKSMDEVLLQLNKLKASDLASMSNNGLFTNLSSLVNSNSQSLSNNENLVLNKILVELNDIKEKQNSLENKILREPKILKNVPRIVRFTINNHDYINKMTTVYFSKEENDGTFLLTGDCKSMNLNKVLDETFYMLFKSNGTKDGHPLYNVEISVAQSFEADSHLNKLSKEKNFVATRTGNLIVLRKVSENIRYDIVIDNGR